MIKYASSVFSLILLTAHVNGHGKLLDPVNRASAWRYFPDRFPKTEYDDEWCAFDNISLNKRNVTCGICGPIYDGDVTVAKKVNYPRHDSNKTVYMYSFEKGSPMYTGEIVRTYKKGQIVEAMIRIDSLNHIGGSVSFRICNLDELTEEPDMLCFEKQKLKFVNSGRKRMLESGRKELEEVYSNGTLTMTNYNFYYRFYLPIDMVCKHCILQWHWFDTINDQLYYNCADISIVDIEEVVTKS